MLAVANNDGNQFTKDEQAKARGIMDQQQSLASGLYSGPIRLESTFTSVKDYSTVMALTASFLDNVSDEEKQTATWRNQRARTLGVAPANNQDTLNDSLAKLMVLVGSGSSIP